jgi:hypothetical protein
MTCKATLATLFAVFPSQRQQVSTMATPICTDVRKGCPAMRNTMVNLGLVGVGFGVGLCDALGDDFAVTSFVASEFAVGALHASSVFEQFSAKSTSHDVVELLLDELVAVLLMYLFLLLSDGTLTTESEVECCLVLACFGFEC